MGSFIYFCEYCSAKLNVDDSWLGKSRECPACHKNITFPDAQTLGAEYDDDFPAAPDFSAAQAREKLKVSAPVADGIASEKSPVDTPNNIAAAAGQAVMLAGSQSSYFWGRLGSAAVYVLAVIALLFGIYLSLNFYWDYRWAEDMLGEKQQLVTASCKLKILEKELSGQFKNTINLLQGSGSISKDGVLEGLQLSDEICRCPDPMPLGLLTFREVKIAQDVLAQYKKRNKMLKDEFINSFGNILILAKQDSDNVLQRNVSQVILQSGSVKKQFYSNASKKLLQLQQLENSVKKAQRNVEKSSSSAKLAELKRVEAASSFVRKQLFPADSNKTVVTTSNAFSYNAPQNDLAAAANVIVSLADGWELDERIQEVDNLLQVVPRLTGDYEKSKKMLQRNMIKGIITLWLIILLTAFSLLVLGDVLRAFFDKADILRLMEGKK